MKNWPEWVKNELAAGRLTETDLDGWEFYTDVPTGMQSILYRKDHEFEFKCHADGSIFFWRHGDCIHWRYSSADMVIKRANIIWDALLKPESHK